MFVDKAMTNSGTSDISHTNVELTSKYHVIPLSAPEPFCAALQAAVPVFSASPTSAQTLSACAVPALICTHTQQANNNRDTKNTLSTTEQINDFILLTQYSVLCTIGMTIATEASMTIYGQC